MTVRCVPSPVDAEITSSSIPVFCVVVNTGSFTRDNLRARKLDSQYVRAATGKHSRVVLNAVSYQLGVT